MTDTHPLVRYQINSRSFLNRARTRMSEFRANMDETSNLFYAALELRFGIEARLSEYLQVAIKNLGRDPAEIKDYVAIKLLKRLTEIDPNYEQAGVVRITNENSQHQTILEFTPVTRELAKLHGMLGELLHYKFFLNNKDWFLRKTTDGQKRQSIGDFADMIDSGISQLAEATRGPLLSHVKFSEILEEVLDDNIMK